MIASYLFRLARQPFAGTLVGLGISWCPWMLPVKRIASIGPVLAFHHPRPSWETHLLLVPRHPIRTLLDLAIAQQRTYFADILLSAKELLPVHSHPERCYILCANGGSRQDVLQVHFHLFVDEPYVSPFEAESLGTPVYQDDQCQVYLHPAPGWNTHLVLIPKRPLPNLAELTDEHRSALTELLPALLPLERQFALCKQGYTLLVQEQPNTATPHLQLHITAGRRIKPL